MRDWEYVESNCEYFAEEGVSTLTIFVTVINELYKIRINSDMAKVTINNLVVIRWVRSSCSSVDGGADEKKLRFRKNSFDFFHNSDARREVLDTKNRRRNVPLLIQNENPLLI
jgi:hypothetical protein